MIIQADTKHEEHLNQDLFMFASIQEEYIIATCGLLKIKTLPQCSDNGCYAFICNVYTKPEYRNQGIRTQLFSYLMEFTKEKNIQRLQLSSDSPAAIHIYQKFGFKKDEWAYILRSY